MFYQRLRFVSAENVPDPRNGCLWVRMSAVGRDGKGGRVLKKYSRAAGERSQVKKVEAIGRKGERSGP